MPGRAGAPAARIPRAAREFTTPLRHSGIRCSVIGVTPARTWPLAVLVAAVAAGLVLFRPRPTDRDVGPAPILPSGRDGGTADPTLGKTPGGVTPPNRVPTRGESPIPGEKSTASAAIEALARALAASDVDAARAAARDLRLLLRTDPAALAQAKGALLDPATRADLRMALALVIGTLPHDAGDEALLAALSKFAGDPAFVRCALLALGAQREPEDEDDVFDLGERPYGANGPGGLGITVRRLVPPGAVETALQSHLSRAEAEVRKAAATALSQSLSRATVRSAFLDALSKEPDDGAAAALGRPLADWAGSSGELSEREAAVTALLARVGEEGFDTYRFRLESAFERLPLPERERADLTALADSDHAFAVRSFALTALGQNAIRGGERAVSSARHALLVALADEDAAVRDLAARWLGRLPYDTATAVRLAEAVRVDIAWNVRFTALESLVKTAPRVESAPVLSLAKNDSDRRVAEKAVELEKSLAGPK